jgi:hypothetical protein
MAASKKTPRNLSCVDHRKINADSIVGEFDFAISSFVQNATGKQCVGISMDSADIAP